MLHVIIFPPNESRSFYCPNDSKFVQEFLSTLTYFAVCILSPQPVDPHRKRLVFRVPCWHQTTAIVLFPLDKPFTLLMLDLVVWFVLGTFSFPSEFEFVFVTPWHHAMATLSLKLNMTFILHIPELFDLVEVVVGVSSPF
jgi:hypothetical protein